MVENNPKGAPEKGKSAPKKNTRKKEQGPKRTKQQNAVARAAHVAEPRQWNHHVPIPVNVKQEPDPRTQILKGPSLDSMIIPDDFKRHQNVHKLHYDERNHIHQLLEARIQRQNQARGGHCLNSSPDFGQSHYPPQPWPQYQLTEQQLSYHLQSSDDDDMFSLRLKDYIEYLRKGIKINTIHYWSKFVSMFYASCGVERWCVSSYENSEQPLLGAFSFSAMDAWGCDLCGANSGKGFEASYEILPRLLQMRFESGELDQNLHLESPGRLQLNYGTMLLDYRNAVLETTYEQGRVIRKGRIRAIIRRDLRILSWQFCAQSHEEYLSRRLVVPEVIQLIDASNRFHSSLYNRVHGNVSEQQLLADGNTHKRSGQQLTSFVEQPLINDLGFSAKHGRGLEMATAFHSMKDLIDFSLDTNTGPIESLQSYPRVGNNTSMWGNAQTEAQQTSGLDSTQAIHFSEGHINNDGTLPNSNGVVFNDSGQDRTRFHVYHQGFQSENPLNTMQSTSSSNHEQQGFLASQSGQSWASPYPIIHSDYNPGSVNNSSEQNSKSSSPGSATSKTVPQDASNSLFDQAMEANNRNGNDNVQ